MKTHPKKFDLIVVGGGPAGMMAAGTAAKRGQSVLLLEKNSDLGEKLKITGGGRCNITNYELDTKTFLSHYGKYSSFLHSPFSQFSVKDTFTFFEKNKLPLDIQARNRVFPKSENAHDVQKVLKTFLKKNGVEVHYGEPVKDIQIKNNTIQAIDTQHTRYTANSFIFSTGGMARPETGSTGDGFKWLKKMKHTVHSSNPNIVPLRSHEPWIKKLSGTSLSFMKISFFVNQKKAFSKKGKILFTHFGISSPLILNSSQEVHSLLQQGSVHAEIDLFPDTNKGSLDKRLLKLLDQNKNKKLINILPELLPKKIAEVILDLSQLENKDVKAHSLAGEERKKIIDTMKQLPLSINGLMGMDRAVVADGGVPLEEIDTRTMKSKYIKNLYIIGDMLHINRPSGGYSLQLCWTTGYVAGMHA